MKRWHIVGRKNHGKTGLVVDLVRELTRRGLRIGTIKHTHHRHELDTPGKDSHDHRLAGAAAVGIISPGLNAVFFPRDPQLPHDDNRAYGELGPVFAACDLVLVEGDLHAEAPKVEVWRSAAGGEPLAAKDSAILAVVSDDAPEISVPVLSRCDVPAIADWLLRQEAKEAGGAADAACHV